jgi:hypothetical protein
MVSGAHPKFFSDGAGGDPEFIYNLSFILKIMLKKLCRSYNSNIIPFATAFRLYIRTNITTHSIT